MKKHILLCTLTDLVFLLKMENTELNGLQNLEKDSSWNKNLYFICV